MITADMLIQGLREKLDRKTIIAIAYLQARSDENILPQEFYKNCVEISIRRSIEPMEFFANKIKLAEILRGFVEREVGKAGDLRLA